MANYIMKNSGQDLDNAVTAYKNGTLKTQVEDTLTSTSAASALSANQGRILNETKPGKIVSAGTVKGEIFNDYDNNTAAGRNSHAEGSLSAAPGDSAHAEGKSTTASGYNSHAEGKNAVAQGYASHAEGYYTVAKGDNQHVQGKYNVPDSTSAFIIGNGTSNSAKSNAMTVDWDGNAVFSGIIKANGKKGVAAVIDCTVDSVNVYADGSKTEYYLTVDDTELFAELSADGPGDYTKIRFTPASAGKGELRIYFESAESSHSAPVCDMQSHKLFSRTIPANVPVELTYCGGKYFLNWPVSDGFGKMELPNTYTTLPEAAKNELAYPEYGVCYLHLDHGNGSEESGVCLTTKYNDADDCISQLLITNNGFYRRWYPIREAGLVTDPDYGTAYDFQKLAVPDILVTKTYTGTIPSGSFYTSIDSVGGDGGNDILKTINVSYSSAPVLTSFNGGKIYVSRMPGDGTTGEVTFSITYHTAYAFVQTSI